MTKDKSILINNIYHMLSYAFKTLNQETYKDVAVESFDEMYDLLAAILSKGIGLQLKQGLYREYINHNEELSVMRGKINMPDTIKNRLAHKRVITCDFDELSENNMLNQILKTTVFLLLRNGKVKTKYKDQLKTKMLYFSNVDLLEPVGIRWSSIRFQRNNQTYRMLISICQLIIEGMLITTESGEYRLASFIDEQRMCRLYEKFILEYYIRHFPQLSVKASQIAWALDDGIGTMLPVMQSDIHLQKGSSVLIIDAKYYSRTTQTQYDKHTLHSNNLYQIFTYVKNRHYEFGDKPHVVSGMLLYAKTEEEIQPDNEYQMHGSKISVKTLDLNLPFAEIARQLNHIATEHFGDDICTKGGRKSAKEFEDITKYIPYLKEDKFGEWISDHENDGSAEHPIRWPFVNYSEMVISFEKDVYKFEDEHPEMNLNSYSSILEDNNIEWSIESMSDADVSQLDAICIMALLIGALRAEQFCDGALLKFFKNGSIGKWLERLEKLDYTN